MTQRQEKIVSLTYNASDQLSVDAVASQSNEAIEAVVFTTHGLRRARWTAGNTTNSSRAAGHTPLTIEIASLGTQETSEETARSVGVLLDTITTLNAPGVAAIVDTTVIVASCHNGDGESGSDKDRELGEHLYMRRLAKR